MVNSEREMRIEKSEIGYFTRKRSSVREKKINRLYSIAIYNCEAGYTD